MAKARSWRPGFVPSGLDRGVVLALLVGAVGFGLAFWEPFATLLRDWWNDPDAAHGLLLAPLALFLAWREGLREDRTPRPWLGTSLLLGAVALRYLSGLAAELYTMRMSLLGAVAAVVVLAWGFRQLLEWWLPAALIFLSVPLPEVIVSTLALPLQLRASSLGASLLEWRHVPVELTGNVIRLPSRALFVTEACSGLRSLTALLALGVLMGGLWLRHPVSRILLVALTIPVAMAVNGFRVFLTGFAVHFVDPALGDGVMHYTEGWVLFVVSFLFIGGVSWLMATSERWLLGRRAVAA